MKIARERPIGEIGVMAMVGVLAWATASHRHLFADGSAFFGGVLLNQGFFIPRWERATANIWTQLPVVIALKLGLRSVEGLSWLMGLGLFAIFPNSMAASRALVRATSREDLLPSYWCTFALFALVSCFAVTESLVAACVFWPPLLWSLDPQPLTRRRGAVLVVCLLVGLAAYESFLVLGPIWILAAALRLRARGLGREVRFGLWAMAAAGLGAFAVAFVPSLVAEDPMRGHFFLSLSHVRGWRTLWFVLLALIGGLAALELHTPSRVGWKVAAVVAGVFSVFVALMPWVERTAEPGNNYSARVFSLILPAGIGLWQLLRRGFGARPRPVTRTSVILIAAFGLAAAIHQGAYVSSWQHYQSQFRRALALREGAIPFEESLIHPSHVEMKRLWQWNWDWTTSALSVWLARFAQPGDEIRSVVVCPGAMRTDQVLCPLSPWRTRETEILEREYGLRYSAVVGGS